MGILYEFFLFKIWYNVHFELKNAEICNNNVDIPEKRIFS